MTPPAERTPPVGRRVVVSGRVQGVWYRAETVAVAERHGVRGWVRNRRDGRVEAVLEGPVDAVAAVEAWMHDGPPRAFVTSVDAHDEAPEGHAGFAVR